MDKDFFDHLKEVNRTFYDQVRGADQKAAYIFTFMLALLIWSSEVRNLFTIHRYEGAGWPVILLSGVAATALCVAFFAAIWVVVPRTRSGGSSLFWGNWDAAGERLFKAAEAREAAFLVEEYKVNISHLAAICRAKYFWVGVAFRALVVTIAAHLALLAIR